MPLHLQYKDAVRVHSDIFGNMLLVLEYELLCPDEDHKELHEDRTKER